VNTHNWVANCPFQNVEHPHCHQVAQWTFRAEVASVLVSAVSVGWVEVNLFLCTPSKSAEFFRCRFGKEGIRQFGFDKA